MLSNIERRDVVKRSITNQSINVITVTSLIFKDFKYSPLSTWPGVISDH